MFDVIIIGAGPAGLTAAIYLKRANKSVLVIDAKNYGGAIINALKIDNYPALPNVSGYDLATKMYKQAKELGAKFQFERVLDIKNGKTKKVITSKNTYLTKSIIIATGTSNRKLGIDEDRFVGKGVSFCAVCDGNFYKEKVVAVVGGGNSAIDDALYLSGIAKKVYLIHRREEFRAFDKNIELLKNANNVSFILNSNITKINGKDKLESIEINHKDTIKVDGLFIAIGQIPENETFKKIIRLDNDGYVRSNNTLTNMKGIFVAGDIRGKKVRQLVTAMADGCMASIEVINYLNK